jgi:DNA primase large subunit
MPSQARAPHVSTVMYVSGRRGPNLDYAGSECSENESDGRCLQHLCAAKPSSAQQRTGDQ